MAGVISASSQLTAEIGAEILEMGGNAISAAVAACFATTVGEPSYTSLAGGGLLLFHNGKTGKKTVLDFFGNVPGKGLINKKDKLNFLPVNLDYGSASQTFYIGRASAAVDGIIPGLCEFASKYGNIKLEKTIQPTIDRLKRGAYLPKIQYDAMQILEPVLTHTALASKYFAPQGKLLTYTNKYHNLDLAKTLEKISEKNWKHFYFKEFKSQILQDFGPEVGGLITPTDIDTYQINSYKPLVFSFNDAKIFFPPSPALGGEIISTACSLFPSVCNKFEDHSKRLSFIMKILEEIRHTFPHKIFSKEAHTWGKKRIHEIASEPLGKLSALPSGKSCTTHISVADSWKNVVSVTISHGEGCGYMISDTGIMMNNLMGEKDLSPLGFFSHTPGRRLQTMMSPCIVETKEGDVFALGTGGANRIRSAILQTLINLLHRKKSIQEAISLPRIHFDHGTLFVELCDEYANKEEYLKDLKADKTIFFPEKNFFFGGVNIVKSNKNGSLSGAGDSRRGGACITVS